MLPKHEDLQLVQNANLFLDCLDERLLDMATGPDDLISPKDFLIWHDFQCLGHVARRRYIQDAVAGAYQASNIQIPLTALYPLLEITQRDLEIWANK